MKTTLKRLLVDVHMLGKHGCESHISLGCSWETFWGSIFCFDESRFSYIHIYYFDLTWAQPSCPQYLIYFCYSVISNNLCSPSRRFSFVTRSVGWINVSCSHLPLVHGQELSERGTPPIVGALSPVHHVLNITSAPLRTITFSIYRLLDWWTGTLTFDILNALKKKQKKTKLLF